MTRNDRMGKKRDFVEGGWMRESDQNTWMAVEEDG